MVEVKPPPEPDALPMYARQPSTFPAGMVPWHCQENAPPSLATVVGVPVLQSPVVGALDTVVLLAGPQTPSLVVMPPDDPEVPEPLDDVEPLLDPELEPLPELDPAVVPLELLVGPLELPEFDPLLVPHGTEPELAPELDAETVPPLLLALSAGITCPGVKAVVEPLLPVTVPTMPPASLVDLTAMPAAGERRKQYIGQFVVQNAVKLPLRDWSGRLQQPRSMPTLNCPSHCFVLR